MLNVKFNIENSNANAYLIEGRSGKIVFEGKQIGFIGEVHPRILKNFKLKMPAVLCEIGLEEVFNKII